MKPELKINQFTGPLDLLFHLIEKNDIDIYDIPITEITDQYLAFLDQMESMDMEVVSEFIVMASTLIYIKSRLLLPSAKSLESQEDDPRDELVIRLLRYRRCKILAGELKHRYETHSFSYLKTPSSPKDLDIKVEIPVVKFENDRFEVAISCVMKRNELRFQDLKNKIHHILRRDKISIGDKISFIYQKLKQKSQWFFHQLFPVQGTEKMERIVGFLAMLELLRGNKIKVVQTKPFDIMEITVSTQKESIDFELDQDN